ncbi:hypothetical protein FOZ60_000565, partial [Perkinsus olseni]
ALSCVCGCYDPFGLAVGTTTLTLGVTNNDKVPADIFLQLLQCQRLHRPVRRHPQVQGTNYIICSDSFVNVQSLKSTRDSSGDLNTRDKSNIHKALTATQSTWLPAMATQRLYQPCGPPVEVRYPPQGSLTVNLRRDADLKSSKWVVNFADEYP